MPCPRLLLAMIATSMIWACAVPAAPDVTERAASALSFAPVPVAIAITPAKPVMAVGSVRQLVATATYGDGTTADVSSQVQWTSSSPIAAVTSTGLVLGFAAGTTTIKAKQGAVISAVILKINQVTLGEIEVTPTNPSLAAGTTQQLAATAVFSDKSTQDVTGQVVWTSDDPTRATVAPGGLVTAVAVGSATIHASNGAVSGSTVVTVTPAVLVAIAIAPVDASLARGRTQAFTATGTFSDQSTQDLTAQVTWSSSDSTIAVISNAPGTHGVATAVDVGTTTIAASLEAVTGAAQLTVTAAVLDAISLAPSAPSLTAGTTLAFTAAGLFSDGSVQDLTTQVVWASSDVAVAVISNATGSQGLATGLAAGATTISATLGAVTGSSSLTVTAAVLVSIAVAPGGLSVAKGHRQQLTATGVFNNGTSQDLTTQVTWASSNPAIAAVSNAAGSRGLVATQQVGSVTIIASLAGVTGMAGLTVTAAVLDRLLITPASLHALPGEIPAFTAFGIFSDASSQNLTTQVTWGSSFPTVATISNAAPSQGRATALAPGVTTITAILGVVFTGATLTVDPLGVVALAPADGASDVAMTAPVVVTFNEAIAPASLTTQRRTGACTGTLQLSADGFASCLGLAFNGPALSAGNTVATVAPAAPLAAGTTYRIRVLAAVTNAGGAPLGTDVTQPTGFTTAP